MSSTSIDEDSTKSADSGIFQLDDLVDSATPPTTTTTTTTTTSPHSTAFLVAPALQPPRRRRKAGASGGDDSFASPPTASSPSAAGVGGVGKRAPSMPFVDSITPRASEAALPLRVGSVKRSAELEGFLSQAQSSEQLLALSATVLPVGSAPAVSSGLFMSPLPLSSVLGASLSARVSSQPSSIPTGSATAAAAAAAAAAVGDDGALPQSKQRRRTRNMDELIELLPSLLAVANFLKTHTCFEMVPNSGKVVVLEAQISLLDALSAMSENELFSATCWDAEKHDFIGLMSPLQLLNSVVHFRNELPPPPSHHDYDASSALAAQLATAAKPYPSSLSKFSTSFGEDDLDLDDATPTTPACGSITGSGGAAAAAAAASGLLAPPLPPSVRDVADADLSLALRNCTVGSWLSALSPLRVNVPTPAAPLPSSIGSPLLARRAATRGLCFIDPNDTLWDACRALLGALDSKLPLIDRDTQSVLCIVTLSRLLACLYNGLRPLPPLLSRSIDLLGVGAFVHSHAGAPRGHVSPRATVGALPPPSVQLGTPLGCALALMAKHHTSALVLVDEQYRPVTILAAADVPALFRFAVDISKPAPPAAPGVAAAPAPMAEDDAAVAVSESSLLSMPIGEAMQHIATRCQRLLTCERTSSLATVMQMLVQNRVHQVVLVDDRGVFDGVVTATDVLRFLCKSSV
jgi:CBS domain-containing protein